MPMHLQIPDFAASTLKDVLLRELAEKLEKLKKLESECRYLEGLIGQINSNQTASSSHIQESSSVSSLAKELGYKDKWTWEQKIKFIIQHRGNTGYTTPCCL